LLSFLGIKSPLTKCWMTVNALLQKFNSGQGDALALHFVGRKPAAQGIGNSNPQRGYASRQPAHHPGTSVHALHPAFMRSWPHWCGIMEFVQIGRWIICLWGWSKAYNNPIPTAADLAAGRDPARLTPQDWWASS
jgi:hypothetical protein